MVLLDALLHHRCCTVCNKIESIVQQIFLFLAKLVYVVLVFKFVQQVTLEENSLTPGGFGNQFNAFLLEVVEEINRRHKDGEQDDKAETKEEL